MLGRAILQRRRSNLKDPSCWTAATFQDAGGGQRRRIDPKRRSFIHRGISSSLHEHGFEHTKADLTVPESKSQARGARTHREEPESESRSQSPALSQTPLPVSLWARSPPMWLPPPCLETNSGFDGPWRQDLE